MARIKWTQEMVVAEIKTLCDKNSPLNLSYIKEKHLPLYMASRRQFGSWKNALLELNIDYEKIKSDTIEKKRKWDKESILSELKRLSNENKKLNYTELSQYNNSLYSAIFRYFSSYEEALNEIGIDYLDVRVDKKWDKNKIIASIRKLQSKGESLNVNSMEVNHGGLYSAGVKQFGTWEQAIKASGLRYEDILKTKPNGYWSREKVKKEVLKLQKDNCELNLANIVKKSPSLLKAACKHYGSWGEALEYILNIDYNSVRLNTKRTEDSILNNIIEIYEKDNIWTHGKLKNEYPALLSAIYKEFGSIENAFKLAGVPFFKTTKEKGYWTKKTVINEILKWNDSDKPLNSAFMKVNYPSLYTSGRNIFGTWEKAIIESGLNYKEVRDDTLTTSYYGYLFEKLVNKLLTELNIKYYKKDFGVGIKPDYIFNEHHWGDAKLSEWSIHGCSTLKKYEPHCKHLTVIYMRGNPDRDSMLTTKTRLVSVYKIIKQLPKRKQTYYFNYIDYIESQLTHIEVDQYIKQAK